MSTAARPSPQDNLLLATLSAGEYRRLLPELELVFLSSGKVIAEPGKRIAHGYFPTTAIISITTAVADHPSGEVGVVGNEGMSGVSLLLEEEHAPGPTRSNVAQSAGYAYRMRAESLRREFLVCGELRQSLLKYTQALITQVAQIAICNRHHRLAEQLCRWLLLRLDRSSGNELRATQAEIASLLGVRREGVAGAANALHRDGVIDYQRGRITVLDRSELECRTCECYAVVGREYSRLVPDWRRRDPLGSNSRGVSEHQRQKA